MRRQELRATATSARVRWPTRAATVTSGRPRRTTLPAGCPCTSLRASCTRRVSPTVAAAGSPCAASKNLRCAVWTAVSVRMKVQGNTTAGASGYRSAGLGTMSGDGSSGCYWPASPSVAAYGLSLNFSSGSVSPWNNSNRGSGFPLRCIQGFTLRGVDSCFGQDGGARRYDSRSFGQPQRRLGRVGQRRQQRLLLVGYAERRSLWVGPALPFGRRLRVGVLRPSRLRVPPALHPRIHTARYG